MSKGGGGYLGPTGNLSDTSLECIALVSQCSSCQLSRPVDAEGSRAPVGKVGTHLSLVSGHV